MIVVVVTRAEQEKGVTLLLKLTQKEVLVSNVFIVCLERNLITQPGQTTESFAHNEMTSINGGKP